MRFTLKALMAAVVVSALLCCVFFTLPAWLGLTLLAIFWLMAPAALIAGIVYGRGYGRAFSIGCVSTGGCIPFLWLYLAMTAIALLDSGEITLDEESAVPMKIGFGALFVLAGISGLVSMAVRWLSLRANQEPAVPQAPPYSVLYRRVTTVTDGQAPNA